MSERIKISETLDEWRYTLSDAGKTRNTVTGYMASVRQLESFLENTDGMSTLVGDITTRHLRRFLGSLRDAGKEVTTIVTRWAGLRAYFAFLTSESMIDTNPMLEVTKPTGMVVKVVPAIATANIKALLASCDRKTFRGSRDYAIMRLLMSGMRRGEIANVQFDDLDISGEYPTLLITKSKTDEQRLIALSAKDVVALTQYMRQRKVYVMSRPSHHPAVKSPMMFVSKNGGLSGSGIEHMLNARCNTLGIKRANAHAWRHTWAGEWKAAGGSDEGLMAQGGWSTNREIKRYTAHNRQRSSIAEAQRLSLTSNL